MKRKNETPTDSSGFLRIEDQITPGQRFRFLRLSYKPGFKQPQNQTQLSRLAGYATGTDSIESLENDRRTHPRAVARLCDALRIKQEWLHMPQEKWNSVIRKTGLKARPLNRQHKPEHDAPRSVRDDGSQWVAGVRKPRTKKKAD
jgi:hypothetical protein